MQPAPILSLDRFHVSISGRPVLRSITLDVPAAGVTVILGPSGTGKSTLLRSLAGLNDDNPAFAMGGDVRFCGESLRPGKSRPALVVQKAKLMIATVLDSMLTNLPKRSTLTRLEQIAEVTRFCAALGQNWVIDRLTSPLVQLSFHEQRGLSILREALAQPALLMLDEPTSAMDAAAARQVCDIIARVASMRPVLMVSHHLAQSRHLASQVALIASGVVQESGPSEVFFAAPATDSGRCFLQTGSCPELTIDDAAASTPPDLTDSHCASGHRPPLPDVKELPTVMAPSQFAGPRGFVWLIPGRVAGTPLPGILRDVRDDLAALRDVGITHLVSLTEQPFDATLAAEFGIRCTHFSIPDMAAPSPAAAAALCDSLTTQLREGGAVAFHCRAGLGRTGTLLATYLIWAGAGRCSAESAIALVRRLDSKMIQSHAQEEFLRSYPAYLVAASA